MATERIRNTIRTEPYTGLPVYVRDEKGYAVRATAPRRVVIHPEIETVIHEGADLPGGRYAGQWLITETKTGRLVGAGRTRGGAADDAKAALLERFGEGLETPGLLASYRDALPVTALKVIPLEAFSG